MNKKMSNANKFSDPNKMSMGKAKRLIILKTDDYIGRKRNLRIKINELIN